MQRLFRIAILAAMALAGCSAARPTPAPPTLAATGGHSATVTEHSPTGTTVLPKLSPETPTAPIQETVVLTDKRKTTETTPAEAAPGSPFPGVDSSQLAAMVANPYHPPEPGSDDPHQGVDLADRRGPSGAAIAGMPVQAVLSGKVGAAIADRFPYGNAVMIETPLPELPAALLENLAIPEPLKEPPVIRALTCPPAEMLQLDASQRSLYLLYAHLESPPALHLGEPVAAGQVIGAIGASGNALNPHLHLEVRVGPGGARFESMAHYDNSASQAEMAEYCLWRVSGEFLTIDPMKLFNNY